MFFLTFVEVLTPKCSSKKSSVLGGEIPIVKTKLSLHHGFEESINS